MTQGTRSEFERALRVQQNTLEQLVPFVPMVYLFGLLISPIVAAGLGVLTLLFVGSTRFTESISKSRYPEYADYQRRTSAVIPWPTPSSTWANPEARVKASSCAAVEPASRMW